ncbi:hypothetical protein Y695_02198 [Hydrogenophaga sp. T4]|nr:hypothetical protein Y695_02198 [Hydrogenophaga sp. T4]
MQALLQHARDEGLSSLHLLFAQPQDVAACEQAGMMLRHTVQFHWQNRGVSDFDHFLASLQQEKRKKIRQERRKVAEAGVSFRWSRGADISSNDWDFFYRCYERTYLEHGNAPYLNRDFFHRLAHSVPENWLLFVAEREGRPVAASLIGIDAEHGVAYGRYWGALERVDCLHFEACYYQPWPGASNTVSSASKAAPRANTRWRAPCCRFAPPARTGWPTPPSPMRWSVFCSARVMASDSTSSTSPNAARSR